MHVIFDTEIVGTNRPVFLICTKVVETGETQAFWFHKRGHMAKFRKMLDNPAYTWVGFNSENFDRPLIAAAMLGCTAEDLKMVAMAIIGDEDEKGLRSWQTYKEFEIDFIEYDHIDLYEVAPGVKISLKTYAGRLGFPTMVDMPFHHNDDLTDAQLKVLEKYCLNDLGVTEALFKELQPELALRAELSETHGIDMRSKSDAQIAEAILKDAAGIGRNDAQVPSSVRYTTPDFIKTDSPVINEIIELLNDHLFKINFANGSPLVPEFLEEPFKLGFGTYQMGVGGLHSTHDQSLYLEATDRLLISDFDVASYYPNIMIKAGLTPRLGGNKGQLFMDAYKDIYEKRMEAKRGGNKRLANSLKITLNGTFGKLGNIYCPFYSPDLMLAVTITGQLNLLCLIHDLEKIKGVQVRSANTDGVLVAYPASARRRVLGVFTKNSKRTQFEYEETAYWKYAAKDVNNYMAITDEREVVVIKNRDVKKEMSKRGKIKRKGLYGQSGVKTENNPAGKNPTMEVCTYLALDYLQTGVMDISKYNDIKDFVAVRNAKGGAIQYDRYELVDDWVCVKDVGSAKNEWRHPDMKEDQASVKRKSRPAPREVGLGGLPLGRVVRWYMTTKDMPAIHYIDSGNRVPKTEGARVLMTLTDSMPKDIDKEWYLLEAQRILQDTGVVSRDSD